MTEKHEVQRLNGLLDSRSDDWWFVTMTAAGFQTHDKDKKHAACAKLFWAASRPTDESTLPTLRTSVGEIDKQSDSLNDCGVQISIHSGTEVINSSSGSYGLLDTNCPMSSSTW